MSLQTSLCTYIETKSAITDLIGTSPCRFFPQIAKGNVDLPYAVYSRASVERKPKASGSTGFCVTVIRITSFAQQYDDACNLADQFRIVLDGKIGTVGAETIDSCRLIDERDNIDPVEFAQNDAPHFVSQDYQIMHRESIPTL
jgi:hypothetical protein